MIVSRTTKILLFAGIIAFLNPISNAQEWIQFGPWGCELGWMKYNPHDTTMVVGSTALYGGYWISEDGGDNWDNHILDFPENVGASVIQVEFHPNSSDTIWAVGSSNLLYRSTDAGENWGLIDNGFEDEWVRWIYALPDAPGTLFTQTGGVLNEEVEDIHLFRSSDNGDNWIQIDIEDFRDGYFGVLIRQDPTDSDHLFMAINWTVNIFETFDGGDTWDDMPGPTYNIFTGATGLEIDPEDPLHMLMSSYDTYYSSEDGGENWEMIEGLGWDPVEPLYVDAAWNIYIWLWDVFKSTDRGETWTILNPSTEGMPSWGGYFHVASNPLNEETVLLSDYAGLYRSYEGGRNATTIGRGFGRYLAVRDILVNPADEDENFAINWSGLWRGTTDADSWERINFFGGNQIEIIPVQPYNLYVINPGLIVEIDSDNGRIVNELIGTHGTFTDFVIHPTDPSILYCTDSYFYRSEDSGETWTDTLLLVSDIAVTQRYPDRVYAGGRYGLHISEDTGLSWELVNDDIFVYEILLQPGSSGMFVNQRHPQGRGSTIQYSDDSGESFEPIPTPTPDMPVRDLAIRPGTTEHLFILDWSSGNIFHTEDYGENWEQIVSPGVGSSSFKFTSDGTGIYIGTGTNTSGSGIWAGFDMFEPSDVKGDVQITIPDELILHSVYPNPFNYSTLIDFSLFHQGTVELNVYNLHSRLVRNLIYTSLHPGRHRAIWNGKDTHGRPVSSGVYYVNIRFASKSETAKLLFIK
ncbi:MAG: hypothetical protein P9L92_19275 [Candidatus Electryonea clarkiae]|nr:hypothetical protein [Candidatus Electryonea clarkiae]MDP8287402.1 hypothetical protein [Candidatus Electryonea clarkiae]